MWHVLHKEILVNEPHCVFIKERLKLPNGQETDWYRFEDSGNSAAIIARNDKGQILLQREYSYPQQKILIDIPGGAVPTGEDMLEGANRELMEEAGYRAGKLQAIGSYLGNRRRSNSIMHVYLATDLTEERLEGDIEEEIEIFWATEIEIDQMILNNKIVSPRLLSAWTYYTLRERT